MLYFWLEYNGVCSFSTHCVKWATNFDSCATTMKNESYQQKHVTHNRNTHKLLALKIYMGTRKGTSWGTLQAEKTNNLFKITSTHPSSMGTLQCWQDVSQLPPPDVPSAIRHYFWENVRYIYYIVKEMPTMPNPGNRWGNRVKRNAELYPSFLSGQMPIMPNFAMAHDAQ